MRLVFKNSVTKKEFEFNGIDDLNDSKMFFHFNIQLQNKVDEGSYDYILYGDNNEKLATGLCQIGDFVQVNTAYTKNNEFIQYKG